MADKITIQIANEDLSTFENLIDFEENKATILAEVVVEPSEALNDLLNELDYTDSIKPVKKKKPPVKPN